MLAIAAVPVDGDPGAWKRLEAIRIPRHPSRVDAIERAAWWNIHVPPPAA